MNFHALAVSAPVAPAAASAAPSAAIFILVIGTSLIRRHGDSSRFAAMLQAPKAAGRGRLLVCFYRFKMGKASRRTASKRQEAAMQINKQEVVDLFRKEGKNEHVQKALQELPDKIDHEQHAQMIQRKFGIDPGKLAEKAIEKELR
jgi:hypothetical protein